jgi:hypothetical protein
MIAEDGGTRNTHGTSDEVPAGGTVTAARITVA